MSELVRKALNRSKNGELNIWDLCMYGEVPTDQFPCSDCSLCGGHRTCPIRFELDLGDDIAAERERCLGIVEEVCAKAAETQGDRAEEALLVSSRERYIHGRRLALDLSEEIDRLIRGGQ